jgi:hypothetical protein
VRRQWLRKITGEKHQRARAERKTTAKVARRETGEDKHGRK